MEKVPGQQESEDSFGFSVSTPSAVSLVLLCRWVSFFPWAARSHFIFLVPLPGDHSRAITHHFATAYTAAGHVAEQGPPTELLGTTLGAGVYYYYYFFFTERAREGVRSHIFEVGATIFFFTVTSDDFFVSCRAAADFLLCFVFATASFQASAFCALALRMGWYLMRCFVPVVRGW